MAKVGSNKSVGIKILFWVFFGTLPFIPVILGTPFFDYYHCNQGAVFSCQDAEWLVSYGNFAYGVAYLFMLTLPISIIGLIIDLFKFLRQTLKE